MAQHDDQPVNPQELPFAAPCHTLDVSAPLRWLKLGWRDLKRAPRQSLTYGTALVIISYIISWVAWELHSVYLFIGLASGFIFIGPVMAIGLYSISCQLQLGLKPRLGYCLREGKRHLGNELVFAVILLVVLLVWARAASMVHVFYPVTANADWEHFGLFLGVGSLIGSLFAAIIFMASAFSLPMIMDRKVDVVTAVVTSINAVLRNKKPMALWAALIVVAMAIGFATAFLGLVILMPLIGHATWHAYQETIVADSWPKHEN
jgi:uncharacterized membrane protein